MRAHAGFAFSLLVFMALLPVPGSAYTPATSAEGVQLRWASGAVIQYVINENFAPNNDNELVRAAIGDALRTLEAALPVQGGSPAVRFEDAGTTSLNKTGVDCVNLITFTATDPDDQLPDGVLAEARQFASTQTGRFEVCGEVQEITAGQILEVDMLFNTSKKFSTAVLGTEIFDIQSLALHEGEHWLGLHHTGIVGAAMSPFGEGGALVRRLHTDDAAGLLAIYGTPGAAIAGLITAADGSPIKGAHVVATGATTGVTTASAVSDENGNYRVGGLPSGSYSVFAEPLDGPVGLGDLPSIFKDGNDDFVTTFLTNPVNVTSGEVSGVNIQAATPAAMNLEVLLLEPEIEPGSEFSVGFRSIRRGTDSAIGMRGTNLAGDLRFSSPRITVFGQRTKLGFQIRDLRTGADAALGPTDIYFGDSSFTGGLIVTVNPQVPSNGIVDGAAFNQNTTAPHYAPGSIISIFGVDMAEQIAEPDRTPLPTQLAGVSVLVGNRLVSRTDFFRH